MLARPIATCTVHWLTPDPPPDFRYEATLGSFSYPIPFNPQQGQGEVDVLALNLAMCLMSATMKLRRQNDPALLEFVEVWGENSEPTLFIHAARGGKVVILDKVAGGEYELEPGKIVLQHGATLRYKPLVQKRPSVQWLVAKVCVSMLRNLLGPDVAEVLLDGYGISETPSATTAPVAPSVIDALWTAMESQFSESTRVLYAQSRFVDFLTGLAMARMQPEAADVIPTQREIVIQLHRDLMALEGRVPTLEDMAARFGVCARTLSEYFKREFGETIHEFLTRSRLERAYVDVLKSRQPLKAVAYKYGYSHVNHFTTAFKNRFGYPPGDARKSSLRGVLARQ